MLWEMGTRTIIRLATGFILPIPAALAMDFDSRSFCKFMNEEGRAYQYRAMELIKICRLFSVTLEQSPHQLAKFQRVLEACDKALDHASGSRKKTNQHTDHEIDRAIKKLLAYEYEKKCDAENQTRIVEKQMEAAKKKDEKNGKKDRITSKGGELRVVRFHIHRSLPQKDPIIVTQVLTSTSEPSDILWCFSHFKDEKRLTLAQNPHFYEGPPAFPTIYGPKSKIQPTTENYQGTIYVLTNNERRVFFELEKNRRIFDNVWKTDNNTLIFKDVSGYIEGEAIVGQSIPALPLFWSRMELPGLQLEEVGHIVDWKAPIHDLWDSPRTGIHIRINDHQAIVGESISLRPAQSPPLPSFYPFLRPPSHFVTPMDPVARPPSPPSPPIAFYYRPPTPPIASAPGRDYIAY